MRLLPMASALPRASTFRGGNPECNFCPWHPHCRGHPPSGAGIQNATSAHGIRTAAGIHLPGRESRMQLLPMASSPDGLISARYAVIMKTPGGEVLTTSSNVNVTQGHGC